MIITIKNLRAEAILGAYQVEKQKTQIVLVNAKIDFDPELAPTSDNVEDTLNYHPICDEIVRMLETTNYNLIEKAVTDVGNYILSVSPRVKSAIVEISKPQAPIKNLESISITETFTRK